MKLVTTTFPGEFCYILPVGDCHWGDKAFKKVGLRKLQENLDWAMTHQEHTALVIMGDLFNIAGRNEKTSPFESDPEEVLEAQEFFRPYAHLIKGAVRGNHERRMVNNYGIDPLKVFCFNLQIPYLGASGILQVRVGKRPEENWYWQTYYLAIHHSTGGGGKIGNSVSNATKLQDIFEGCDAYLIGHNHNLATAVKTVYYPTSAGIKERKVHFVSCGSYLSYDGSYAEDGMLAPTKLGSPRLRLDGRRDKHDLHISI